MEDSIVLTDLDRDKYKRIIFRLQKKYWGPYERKTIDDYLNAYTKHWVPGRGGHRPLRNKTYDTLTHEELMKCRTHLHLQEYWRRFAFTFDGIFIGHEEGNIDDRNRVIKYVLGDSEIIRLIGAIKSGEFLVEGE